VEVVASLNYYITQISSRLFISHGSVEKKSIDSSINYLTTSIKSHFGNQITNIILFGSYTRGTIIPRKYDLNSDVDIMIVFNTNIYPEKKPNTYRQNLNKFVDYKYPRSISSKDLPSVMLTLSKIKFDLVPALISTFLGTETIYIPKTQTEWQSTDPKDFNSKLSDANKRYKNIVKPIIRLLKYWNHKNSYPYDSYELEQIIAKMNFRGDTLESGFYYAIDNLPTSWRSDFTKQKVKTILNNKNWIVEYLKRDNIKKAKETFHRIIP
jgi:predicted nucleotidyltransferase/ribosomal protein S15P/S13E